MPFLSRNDAKDVDAYDMEALKNVAPPEASFGETFAAAIGGVIDEELSISRELNREGWAQRKKTVEQMMTDGRIENPDNYRVFGGNYNFDKLSADYEEILSDSELHEERNELLAQRRAYREDVFERGSGVAQFLGAVNAYMLDPISIVSMPISGVNVTAKGLQAVGQAALRAGAIEAGIETMIQPLVYQHKHDIGSPYSWKDALTSITTAAIGGAAIASVPQGIKEFIGQAKERAIARDLGEAEYLARMEDTLSQNPLRKEGMNTEELIEADRSFLETMEVRRERMGQPTIKPEDFVLPERTKAPAGSVSQRERSVVERSGNSADYDQDIQAFKSRQGGEPKRIDEMPQDFKGVIIREKVKVKETGQTVDVKTDANVAWRRATKRRNIISRLEGCLNA